MEIRGRVGYGEKVKKEERMNGGGFVVGREKEVGSILEWVEG